MVINKWEFNYRHSSRWLFLFTVFLERGKSEGLQKNSWSKVFCIFSTSGIHEI